MYVLSGELIVKKDPQALIGEYGLYHQCKEQIAAGEVPQHHCRLGHISLHGSERFVLKTTHWMQRKGIIWEGLEAEHITTPEQADKYNSPDTRDFSREGRDADALLTEIAKEVDEGEVLIGGSANLWQKKRFPTPHLYLWADGNLQSQLAYDPEQGWQSMPPRGSNKRLVVGLVPLVKFSLNIAPERR